MIKGYSDSKLDKGRSEDRDARGKEERREVEVGAGRWITGPARVKDK